jgi:glyoxalase-like protein
MMVGSADPRRNGPAAPTAGTIPRHRGRWSIALRTTTPVPVESTTYSRPRDPAMIRLRQVALVASELDAVVAELGAAFGLEVCFVDPGVGEFGLHNALMLIGDQFLEVVSPRREGTTAGRLLDRRRGDDGNGDGGYMAIYEVDDLDHRVEIVRAAGTRVAWSIDLPEIRARHLHPRDVGGAIVSIDQPTRRGEWPWGGPTWRAHDGNRVVTAIAGISVGAVDPAAMRQRWAELGLDHAVRFVPAGARGEGIDGLDLVATDRDRAGESIELGGVAIRLV